MMAPEEQPGHLASMSIYICMHTHEHTHKHRKKRERHLDSEKDP